MPSKKKCKDTQVLNPITNRCILVNGITYNNVFKSKRKVNKAIKNGIKLTKKAPPRNNPHIDKINVNKEIIKGIKLKKKPRSKKTSSKTTSSKKTSSKTTSSKTTSSKKHNPPKKQYKKCPQGKVLNTHTNRCILVGTALYKKALKNGWLHFENLVPDAPQPPLPKSNTKDCKNKTTFMMFDEVENIEGTDLIKTPEGYCFSAEELIAYISSEAYDNKNPHEIAKILFSKADLDNKKQNQWLLKHPKVVLSLKNFFKKKDEEEKIKKLVYLRTIDTLLEICNTGRICYYNNITSHEDADSSTFDKSIQALANLSEIMGKLSAKDKEAYSSVLQKIDQANKGETCIHGVGSFLMLFALKEVHNLPSSVGQVFDSEKTGLEIGVKTMIGKPTYYIVSKEHRFTPHPTMSWISGAIQPFGMVQPILSAIMKKNLQKVHNKSKAYEEGCEYPSYLITNDAIDEWKEIEDWRKVKLGDKFSCFDIFFLIKTITSDLNTTKNNNPYPTYPTNPFTRKLFAAEQLNYIKHICNDNFISLNPPLKTFLNTPELWMTTINAGWRNRMIDKLEDKGLRFVRRNNFVHGELHCTGEWNLGQTIAGRVEQILNNYLNTADPRYIEQLKKEPSEATPDEYYFQINIISSPSLIETKELN